MMMMFKPKDLKQLNKKRKKKKDREKLAYDEQPKALQNKASRPRFTEKEQEYKCACGDVSGVYCPLCAGEDKECEVCACDCDVAL